MMPASLRTRAAARRAHADNVRRYGRDLAERIRYWQTGGPELSEEDTARCLDLQDGDERIVNAYVDGHLPDSVARQVEDRLVHDEAFFREQWPMVAMARLSPDFWARVGAAADADAQAAEERRHRQRQRFLLAGLVVVLVALLVVRVAAMLRGYGERKDGRAETTNIWLPRVIDAQGTAKVRHLQGQEIVVLPSSRLTYRGWAVASGAMALDGTATFDMWGAEPILSTRYAEALLRPPGRYVVSTPMGATETVVDVLAGTGLVGPLTPWLRSSQMVNVPAGHRAIVGPGRTVVITTIPGYIPTSGGAR